MSDISPTAPVTPTSPTPTATQQPQAPVTTPPVASGGSQGGQVPSGTATTQPQQPSVTTVLQGSATEIDSAARELSNGGQIAAQVVARDQAVLLVRTAAGNTLSLANLMTKMEQANIAVLNAALKIQLNPENPQQATVVSANGVALQPPLTAQAQPPTAAQLAIALSPPQPGGTATPVLPQPGQSLNATVVVPPQGVGNTATTALPAGTQIQVVVQSASLPATTASPVPAAPASAQLVQTAAVTPAPVAQAPVAPPPLPNVVASAPVPAVATPAMPTPAVPSTVAAPVAAALLQQAMPASPAAPAQPQPLPTQAPAGQVVPQPNLPQPVPGQVIVGVVAGNGQHGQTLVSTSQGVLSLNLPQPLPPGTQLALELATITRPTTSASLSGTMSTAGVLTRLQGEWPALQQTLDALRTADPALAQRLQNDLLPQPNARLAAAALQFMAAAAVGNAQAWLGSEAVRKLERDGKGELLKKLDDDFRELGKLNSRQSDTDWQAVVMPMLIGGKVEPIQIFMRRRKDKEKKQAQTRFIIDFNLESTGPIQFDGFVSAKQLDLILRSETEFGPAFKLDVTAIFTNALDVTGMNGSIRFHDREKPLPWPSPELKTRTTGSGIRA